MAWGEVTLCYLLPKPTTNAKCIDSLCPLLLWQIVRHSLLSHLPQRLVNNIVATTAKGHTITNPFGCRAVPGGCAVKSVGWERAEPTVNLNNTSNDHGMWGHVLAIDFRFGVVS